MSELPRTPDERRAVTIRPARADEWGRWRETRLRMLRDDADFFSTRYDDMVREPDKTWRDWVGEAAVGDQKTLFVADEDDQWLGVVGAFVRVNPLEVQLISMWVDPQARGRGIAQAPDPCGCRVGARARLDDGSSCSSRRPTSPPSSCTSAPGFAPTGDRAPAGCGRSAFKLVLAAPVASS